MFLFSKDNLPEKVRFSKAKSLNRIILTIFSVMWVIHSHSKLASAVQFLSCADN